MEVIDIGDLEPITLNLGDDLPASNVQQQSANFGDGLELFMNDSQRSASKQVKVDLSDLDKLEGQLNNLAAASSDTASSTTRTISGMAANLFGYGTSPAAAPAAAASNQGYETSSKLGQSTTSNIGTTKTWDGYTKVSDIPSANGSARGSANMSEKEQRRKKREMIKKLQEWYESGQIKQSSHYTMDSPFDEVEDEYDAALENKRRKDSVKLQGWWFITLINSLEYANSAFDPFGINLDGWGEKISEDLPEYEEIFGELYEKYKGGKLAPELALLMRLGFSAAVVGFSNKALSAAAPGFNDILRQSPELMRTFNDATVKALSQQSPGFAFASNLMKPAPEDVSTTFGPPPKPVETKSQPPPTRPGAMQFTPDPTGRNYAATAAPNNRPDIALGRGAMFREQGVDVSTGYVNANAPQTPIVQQPRLEMRGPQNSDVDSILSGLKMKTVNIHEQVDNGATMSAAASSANNGGVFVEDDSMMSSVSLRDLTGASVPKKSGRRKPRNSSEKNSITLDI